MGFDWLLAGADASAARVADRAIRRNAADKIEKMREALEHSTTSVLWQSIGKPIVNESLYHRLCNIWVAIQDVKCGDKSTATQVFNKTLWLSVKRERLAPSVPGYMEFWHALADEWLREALEEMAPFLNAPSQAIPGLTPGPAQPLPPLAPAEINFAVVPFPGQASDGTDAVRWP